jgi:hypothetical protein
MYGTRRQPSAADKNAATHCNWEAFHQGPLGAVQQFLQSVIIIIIIKLPN